MDVLITLHSEGLSTPCLSISEYRCVVALEIIKNITYIDDMFDNIVDSSLLENTLLRLDLVDYFVKLGLLVIIGSFIPSAYMSLLSLT
jgi:hypothetical protein